MTGTDVRVQILGPTEVWVGRERLALGGAKPRAVLALLALEPGRVVAASRIAEALWEEEPTERTTNTLQVHVSNLRRALQPAADALGTTSLIVTRSPGYQLEMADELVDAGRFDSLMRRSRADTEAGMVDAAADTIRTALGLWRGAPLEDLADQPFHARLAVRLTARRREAQMALCDLEISRGRHGEVLDELERAVDDDPLDERACGLYMLALYRSGRQADALAAYQHLRTGLGEQLGLDPSSDLRTLEGQILRQDPALHRPAPRPGGDLDAFTTVLRSSIVAPRVALEIDGELRELDAAVTTVGRRFDQAIVLDDDQVSRAHAELRVTAEGVSIADKGSMNGTKVNGTVVPSAVLSDGDEIVLGGTTMIVHII